MFPNKNRKVLKKKDNDYKEKVIDLRRVARVVAGGKRFRFRATVVLGNENGKVGIGIGKGSDVQDAVNKAKTKAKKNFVLIPLNGRTINHEVEAKYSAARVLLRPAVEGHGLKAGSSVRTVLSMLGIKDITAKCLGRTANKLTNAMATIEALKKIKSKHIGK
ncbi:MAG: 30S ribosomal protein S5 [Candidatus Pacebacteria bacterium]|nr:30S ribosomal protein S5 [Candidatus Paceibacterota bacterium]